MVAMSAWKLFLIYLKVGAFTFGGGYAMIPVFERELVMKHKVIKPESFYDTLVICQSIPGAIAINFAAFTGYKLRGYVGAFASLLGVILPSFIMILLVAAFLFRFVEEPLVEAFFRGVRLSVVALMFLAGWKMLKRNRTWFGFFIIAITLAMLLGFSAHPIIVVVFAGVFGYASLTVKAVVDHDTAR